MKKIILIATLVMFLAIFPRMDSRLLTAAPSIPHKRIGKASWYSRQSPGIHKRTANNEIFNDRTLTGAMWGISFNRRVKVTNLENGKSIIVRINDKGPHSRYIRKGRIIDLTVEAFSQLGAPKKGLIDVEIEFL